MATISSAGIGSGLDVNSIVTQLVALEKAPLKALQLNATNVQAQVSAFGEIQSQFSSLTDMATRIAASGSWSARSASSSNIVAANLTAAPTAVATSFSLDVDALAQQQSIASAPIATGSPLGGGTLTLRLGSWTGAGASFAPAVGGLDVSISIGATDNVVDIAAKINAANAGVVATVFKDGSNQRLLLRSKDTGVAAGFRIQTVDPALDGLVFDPESRPAVGMAGAGIPVQYGQDAKARINGLAVTSATNTLADNIPGATITLSATTTTGYGTLGEVKAPVSMSIGDDVRPAVKNVQDFVTAYNTLNKSLADLTKYDAATKTAGLFQGDSSILGLQNVLRNMVGSTSMGATSQRLSDVGIERQLDGSLTINTTKLSTAANGGDSLQKLFTANNGNPLTNGFALKFGDLGRGVLATGGTVANKASALQKSVARNTQEQIRVNDRAALVEARLRKQYSALDVQIGQLNALNAYVTQQVTLWNRNTA